jgi:O-antigen/teichoic acid export membrane protein
MSLNMGIKGSLQASTITAGTFAFIGLSLCKSMLGFSFSWQVIKSMLKFGLPLVPSLMSSYVLSQADRWFLQSYSTMDVLGIYSLGYRVGSMINLFVVQPFQLIWLPMIFETEKKPGAKHFFEQMLTYMLLFSFWVGLGISLFSKELLTVMATPAYQGAYATIPWIVLAYVIYGGYMVVNIGIYIKNKTAYAMWLVGAAALSNILFNFMLIPSLGGLGAAQATLLSYIILFIIALFVNRRIFPLDYEWIRIAKVALVALSLFACGFLLIPSSIYVTILWKSVIMLAYWGILYLVRFFNPNELELFTTLLQRRFHKSLQ